MRPRRKLPAGTLLTLSCKGSFDCVVTSLRELTTPLRMTDYEDINLLVAEGFDGIESGGFDGGEHAADDADET